MSGLSFLGLFRRVKIRRQLNDLVLQPIDALRPVFFFQSDKYLLVVHLLLQHFDAVFEPIYRSFSLLLIE